jgi:hypothetical protein
MFNPKKVVNKSFPNKRIHLYITYNIYKLHIYIYRESLKGNNEQQMQKKKNMSGRNYLPKLLHNAAAA